jgi:RHS repeat-associated protein
MEMPKVIYTWGVNGLVSQRRITLAGAPPAGGGATTASAKAKANPKITKPAGKTNNFATAKTSVIAKGTSKSSTSKTAKPSNAKPTQTMKAAATMKAGATVNIRATANMGASPKKTKSLAVPPSTSQTFYYHFGPSGETKQLTDGSGTVTDTYAYTAYGVQTSQTGTTENPFRFGGLVGCYSDTASGNTGIILCTFRWYSPVLGRWLTRDPSGYAGGDNLYEYVGGNPVCFVDPNGLDRWLILVPGSFDYDGKLYTPDWRQAVMSTFNIDPAHTVDSPWGGTPTKNVRALCSGVNNASLGTIRAGVPKLLDTMKNIKSRDKTAQFVLVGWSNGGSVILSGLNQRSAGGANNKDIEKAILLATPYFNTSDMASLDTVPVYNIFSRTDSVTGVRFAMARMPYGCNGVYNTPDQRRLDFPKYNWHDANITLPTRLLGLDHKSFVDASFFLKAIAKHTK